MTAPSDAEIEAAAKVMFELDHTLPGQDGPYNGTLPWDELPADVSMGYRDLAVAALLAAARVRDPEPGNRNEPQIGDGLPNEVALRALIHLDDDPESVWRIAAHLNACGVRVPGADDRPPTMSYDEYAARGGSSTPEHAEVETPGWDTKLRCACGAEFATMRELHCHLDDEGAR